VVFTLSPVKYWSFIRVYDRLRRKSSLMSVNTYKELQLPWEIFEISKSEKVQYYQDTKTWHH